MIRNGLYHITIEMLDGIAGGNQGVMVLRDGAMRGIAQRLSDKEIEAVADYISGLKRAN